MRNAGKRGQNGGRELGTIGLKLAEVVGGLLLLMLLLLLAALCSLFLTNFYDVYGKGRHSFCHRRGTLKSVYRVLLHSLTFCILQCVVPSGVIPGVVSPVLLIALGLYAKWKFSFQLAIWEKPPLAPPQEQEIPTPELIDLSLESRIQKPEPPGPQLRICNPLGCLIFA